MDVHFSLAWPQSFNSTCLPQTNFLKHPEKFCKQATSRRAAWRWNSRVAQAILPTPAQSSCKWVLVSSVTSPKARRSTTTSVASSANRMAHKASHLLTSWPWKWPWVCNSKNLAGNASTHCKYSVGWANKAALARNGVGAPLHNHLYPQRPAAEQACQVQQTPKFVNMWLSQKDSAAEAWFLCHFDCCSDSCACCFATSLASQDLSDLCYAKTQGLSLQRICSGKVVDTTKCHQSWHLNRGKRTA